MEFFIDIITGYIGHLGYKEVFLLMGLESSFIPFPSEIIVPPAAYAAHQGNLSLLGVVIAGVAGSLFGAIINYFLALHLGRGLIYSLTEKRFSKFLLIDSHKVERAENYFLRYGRISTLIGRLVPVIRQLISLPAGFTRMNFKAFCFFTALGSSIWVVILALLGYTLGANKELMHLYSQRISIFLLIAGVIAFLYIYRRRRRKKRTERENVDGGEDQNS